MFRYSTEDEKEFKEWFTSQDKNIIPECLKCFHYTRNPEHLEYRCHRGPCPALKKE